MSMKKTKSKLATLHVFDSAMERFKQVSMSYTQALPVSDAEFDLICLDYVIRRYGLKHVLPAISIDERPGSAVMRIADPSDPKKVACTFWIPDLGAPYHFPYGSITVEPITVMKFNDLFSCEGLNDEETGAIPAVRLSDIHRQACDAIVEAEDNVLSADELDVEFVVLPTPASELSEVAQAARALCAKDAMSSLETVARAVHIM